MIISIYIFNVGRIIYLKLYWVILKINLKMYIEYNFKLFGY